MLQYCPSRLICGTSDPHVDLNTLLAVVLFLLSIVICYKKVRNHISEGYVADTRLVVIE